MTHKQNKEFYLISSIGRLDKLVDLEDESPQTFHKLEDAIKAAVEVTQEYALKTYVYKCSPVIMVDTGKIRITKLRGGKQSTAL